MVRPRRSQSRGDWDMHSCRDSYNTLFFTFLIGLLTLGTIVQFHMLNEREMELRREFAVVALDMWQENGTCHALFRIDKAGLGYSGAESLRVYLIIAEKNRTKQVFKPAYMKFAIVKDVGKAEFVANGTCLYYPRELEVKAEAVYRNGEIVPIFVPFFIPAG